VPNTTVAAEREPKLVGVAAVFDRDRHADHGRRRVEQMHGAEFAATRAQIGERDVDEARRVGDRPAEAQPDADGHHPVVFCSDAAAPLR